MNYRLEFELAGLPKMTNPSGSRSTHWRVVKKERDEWIYRVFLATLGKRPDIPLPTAKLTLIRYSSVSPDPDGLVSGFKAIVDGLVKAGILDNDRFKNIGMPNYTWEKAGRGEGKVKVIVESY